MSTTQPPTGEQPVSPWLTTEEAAHYLKTTPAAMHQLRYLGTGPQCHRAGRRVRYHVDDLDAWVRGQMATSA